MPGFANKARRTKKCNCDNPIWRIFEVRVQNDGGTVTTINCDNCHSLWDTKSSDIRNIPCDENHKKQLNNARDLRIKYLDNSMLILSCKIAELNKLKYKQMKEYVSLSNEKELND